MITRKTITLTVVAVLLLLLGGGVGLVLAQGPNLGDDVGTAFTYQGRLMDDGDPANGSYDFQFDLYDDPTSGSRVADTVYVDDKEVSEGLFTVQLDFERGVFTGEARYLEIAVRAADSSGDYTTLVPRQELTPVPYAQYALDSLSTASLQGYPVSASGPTSGQLLQWNGSSWKPATVASGNQPPVAVLQADPAVLMPGETTTTLSLTLSYDPEGGPLTYAFDPTGWTPGAPTSYGSTAVITAEYTAPGDYLAAGWVKDGAGHFDVSRTLIAVCRWWSTIADSTNDRGQYASLAVADGRPAIAYYESTNLDLEYVRAEDVSGSSWGSPVTVDSAGDVGRYASLAVVDGNPAIAYYDGSTGNYDLKYVRATDAAGSTWGTPLTVDSNGSAGLYASLAVVDGQPAIAYWESGGLDLWYVRATDAAGSSWGTPVTVDSTGSVGWHASLAVVDGFPAIAYYDSGSNQDLKYVRATNAAGSSWGTPVTVDSGGDVGEYASLAEVDGRPAIAYYDHTNGHLKYVRASDASGSSWGTPLTTDSAAYVGIYDSLAVVDGRPAIAYREYNNGHLKCVRASDASGSSWGTPLTVDGAGNVGGFASLAEVDGRAAIAYFDSTNHDLRFAIPRPQ
jgi:hypothetical protein